MRRNTEWQDIDDGVTFHDGGPVELEFPDGEILRAVLVVYEDWNGEDEYPVPGLSDPIKGRDWHDATRWRYTA